MAFLFLFDEISNRLCHKVIPAIFWRGSRRLSEVGIICSKRKIVLWNCIIC
jgi:hypothetical protein